MEINIWLCFSIAIFPDTEISIIEVNKWSSSNLIFILGIPKLETWHLATDKIFGGVTHNLHHQSVCVIYTA